MTTFSPSIFVMWKVIHITTSSARPWPMIVVRSTRVPVPIVNGPCVAPTSMVAPTPLYRVPVSIPTPVMRYGRETSTIWKTPPADSVM